MLILYIAQSCSTAGEVFSTALYCKHWSYSTAHVKYVICSSLHGQYNTLHCMRDKWQLRATVGLYVTDDTKQDSLHVK